MLRHFFPFLADWVSRLPDPRIGSRTTYSVEHLFFYGLSLFLLQLGSRRQLRAERDGKFFLDNLLSLSGSDEKYAADSDTLNYLMEKMPPEGLEEITWKLVRVLIRKKVLDDFRFNGDFLVAVDGSRILTFNEKHCDRCLTRKHENGSVTYFHYMLEAKLVTMPGLALSIASVPVENKDGKYDKQDCELNAFYRLAPILKRRFPRLHICVLLDGLYANQFVPEICNKYKWKYFITLKDGSLPTVNKEASRKMARHPGNNLDVLKKDGRRQMLKWACGINYNSLRLNVISCDESKGEDILGVFRYLSSYQPDKSNIQELMEGGRARWKIENEGFNTQKNGGYGLEHNYGAKGFAWKNYYFLIQIAHLIMQLTEKSDIYSKFNRILNPDKSTCNQPAPTICSAYGSLKSFVMRLRESFSTALIRSDFIINTFAPSIQIRMNTS